MIDTYKVGNQIALLRKAKGLTGVHTLAEYISLSEKQGATLCAKDKHMNFVFDLGIQSGSLFLSPVYVRNHICLGYGLLRPFVILF